MSFSHNVHKVHKAHMGAHFIAHMWHDLPSLPTKKNPIVASFLGFWTGGIGVGLYFQSWKDCIYLNLTIVLLIMMGGSVVPVLGALPALVLGCLIGACWGFVRAADSGRSHAHGHSPAPAPQPMALVGSYTATGTLRIAGGHWQLPPPPA